MEKKNIYLVHQYLEKSHFKALYDYSDKYGYVIKDFIVLDKIDILRRFRNEIKSNGRVYIATKRLLKDIINLIKLRFIKNQILIVGIAPYDKLLNKYYKCFKKNTSIYFTSWQIWDGSNFPRGNINNKNKYEELLVKSFKGAACVSKLSENSMKKLFDNTSVVNHSINIGEYKKKDITKNKSSYKKYIYLGQLIERKNIRLISKWIKNNNYNLKFDFAGSGELENEIINLCKEDKRVDYLGKLTKSDIKNRLKDYDYLVLPSKDEPFGIVLLEALAAGVPCIVSDALGPKEIISNGYNGFVFNKEDEVEFNKVMIESLNIEMEKYKQMNKNALESSKQYDGSHLIKKWIDVIKNN